MPCVTRSTVEIRTHFRHTVVTDRHSVPTSWPIYIPGSVTRPVRASRSIHAARTIHTSRSIARRFIVSVSGLTHRFAHRGLRTFHVLLVVHAFLRWHIVATHRIRCLRSVRLGWWAPIERSTPSVVLRGWWL